jgi:hypothetical protein
MRYSLTLDWTVEVPLSADPDDVECEDVKLELAYDYDDGGLIWEVECIRSVEVEYRSDGKREWCIETRQPVVGERKAAMLAFIETQRPKISGAIQDQLEDAEYAW